MATNYINCGFKKAWVMFDLNNGDVKKGGYMWVFKTKKEALEHRKNQHKNKNYARLSKPIYITC